MIWLCLLFTAAWAADTPEPWFGTWSLDPIKSDDPRALVDQAVRGSLLNGGGARNLAPDGGSGVDPDEQKRSIANSVLALLARSGQFTLSKPPNEQDLTLTYAGDAPVGLLLGRKWTKLRSNRGTMKVRAQLSDQLILQRRERTIRITETLLEPDSEGMLAVVVRVDGSGITPMEFRRVYRNLDAEAEE